MQKYAFFVFYYLCVDNFLLIHVFIAVRNMEKPLHNRKLLNIELGRVSVRQYRELPESGIVLVLDNIRSAHNVGSAFRTADSFKADKVWLCGICAVPPSAEIHKSALGAEDSVAWEYAGDTMQAIEALRAEGYVIVSVEQTVGSVMLDGFVPRKGGKYALVFGNEVAGVDQRVVDASDFSLEIPQYGTKHSLNVSVSVGVVLWHFRLGMSGNMAECHAPDSE